TDSRAEHAADIRGDVFHLKPHPRAAHPERASAFQNNGPAEQGKPGAINVNLKRGRTDVEIAAKLRVIPRHIQPARKGAANAVVADGDTGVGAQPEDGVADIQIHRAMQIDVTVRGNAAVKGQRLRQA